jgi:hypothetical protein
MSGRGSRLGGWQTFAAIAVVALVAIAVLVRTAPPPPPGAESAHKWSGGPRSAADSAAYLDSLDEAAERRMLKETMTLTDVAARADIPVESLTSELHLPATVSPTSPLRGILTEHHLTLKDVHDARTRAQLRLGIAAPK